MGLLVFCIFLTAALAAAAQSTQLYVMDRVSLCQGTSTRKLCSPSINVTVGYPDAATIQVFYIGGYRAYGELNSDAWNGDDVSLVALRTTSAGTHVSKCAAMWSSAPVISLNLTCSTISGFSGSNGGTASAIYVGKKM